MLLNLTRPMLTVGLPFLTVCFVSSFFGVFGITVITAILVVFLVAYLLTSGKNVKLGVVIALISAISGALLCSYKLAAEYEPVRDLATQTHRVQGIVTDIDETSSNCYTLKVTSHKIQGVPKEFKTNLYSPIPIEVDLYDKITIEVDFFSIQRSPGFDTAKFYKQKEIYIFAYAQNPPIMINSPQKKPIGYYFKQFNLKLCTITDKFMSGQSAAIVKAMVLGNDGDLLKSTNHNLANAGVIHVTAISGLHVMIASAFFLMLCRWIGLSPHLAGMLSIAVIWGFVALTNFHHSTVRAGIMITLPAIGTVIGRPADSVNSLFFAAFIIAIQNPFAVSDIGFMMTFLATLGIILLQGGLQSKFITKLNVKNKLLQQPLKMLAITLSANALILPVMMLTFKQVSLIAPIANMIATPITPLILLFSFLMLVLGAFPILAPFSNVTAELNTIVVNILLKSSEFFASLPNSFIGLNFSYARIWLIITACAAGIVLVLNKKYFGKVVLVCLSALVILSVCNAAFVSTKIDIITVNTGDGQAVVVIYGRISTVIAIQTDNYLGNEIAKLLESKNVQKIETLIILEESTMEVEPMKYLNEICPISKIITAKTNDFAKYIHKLADGRIGLFDIDVDFRSKPVVGLTMYVKTYSKERAVFLNVRGITLCITDSVEIAKRANCEFLYFYEKNCEQIEHFPANYVILVSDCETGAHNGKRNTFFAYKNVLSLRITDDGKFTLRRG